MKKQLLLLLGTGAYNIYKDEKEKYDAVYEIAGSGIGGFNAELNRLLGYDDDMSVLWDATVWQHILAMYKQKGIESILVLNCVGGASSKNLPHVLQAAINLDIQFYLAVVQPFMWEGDHLVDSSIQLIADMITDDMNSNNIKELHQFYNDDMQKKYGNLPLAKCFNRFHTDICDELMKIKFSE